ncbi:TPA: 50S ribosomal protein L28 [candidate division CPR2 bacterium]|uniref:Large ribosomal subunit protein bL28 n=1 Tax=candidate division CPR2 bacterium GW2011_GWC1_41_48 TaxID=1618344 RepID=A0A0G0Z897_UNCC2|nr:MAG: 50S ribosomal protein L28 [candidate division CPR2 bacterium GW2011_GWC2_39_35]KKR27278.1 MAG: 50S ribosomal protein L28 [candidate division CPR2 bacterium GW2011_GWD2_39_7]KKR28163.1 MAG: 50S ribosomal protein L28 [candidate division CPR2 bacterium GW2011_GWD1_39_7]KKS09248.1 MAG: 50S ribosomal protein L28 [candidate division CPR2 bacterium GW2011_GWC1_41_48]OGB60312.1 MAG: 50S ribosomal protein L28 [candidate division CPR2 bacterium GWD1_39_7]OGB70485.1 MAG: 50S ribosomal protein L28
MANVCTICGKGAISGFSVSHSHRKTKRRWLPNIQQTTVVVDNKTLRVKACAKCIKTQSKNAAKAA